MYALSSTYSSSATRPNSTERKLEIPRDGFDSQLELIALDIIPGGCRLEERKLALQSPSSTVEYSVQHNFNATSVNYSLQQ